MSDRLEQIPLFPLGAVLFPYAEARLHVFEPRYKEMIEFCQEYDSNFGIVLIREGAESDPQPEPYMVGTAVRITGIERYEDGTMDVTVRGERRFRIRKMDDSGSYIVAGTEPVVESEFDETPRAVALSIKARELVREYIEVYFNQLDVEVARIRLPEDPTALSFLIANFLQIGNRQKQHLLETTDTLFRISEMIPILNDHMEMRRQARITPIQPEVAERWIKPN